MLHLFVEPDMPFIVGLMYREAWQMLFMPSEKNPPMIDQLFLFMKRFRTQPSEFYAMTREDRLTIYHREYKILERENQRAEEAEAKARGIK